MLDFAARPDWDFPRHVLSVIPGPWYVSKNTERLSRRSGALNKLQLFSTCCTDFVAGSSA